MRNVLMIAYFFPPIATCGTLRTIQYAKYLSSFGWNPVILTVYKDEYKIECADTSPLDDLSSGVDIYRSRIIEPFDIYRLFGGKKKQFSKESSILHIESGTSKFGAKAKNLISSFLIPDAKIAWYLSAKRKAREIFSKQKIDVIYSTSPPNTGHIIARYLSSKYKKPWVADFRDPWLGLIKRERISVMERLDECLERKVLSEATRITVAWPGILDDMRRRHRDIEESKVILITNGFDEDDFRDLIPQQNEKFTISYAGSIYNERNPEPLFKALKLLFKDKEKLREEIRVVFMGVSDPLLRNLIVRYRLSDVVELVPHLKRRQCIRRQLGSDLLLLNAHSLMNAVPGKLFEYLGIRKPILALVPENTMVAQIVRATRTGVAIDPEDSEKTKNFVLSMYEKWKKEEMIEINENGVDSLVHGYSRKALARRLSDVLTETSENDKRLRRSLNSLRVECRFVHGD